MLRRETFERCRAAALGPGLQDPARPPGLLAAAAASQGAALPVPPAPIRREQARHDGGLGIRHAARRQARRPYRAGALRAVHAHRRRSAWSFISRPCAVALKLLGLTFIVSQATATVVAMTSNFFLNNLFTYRDQRLQGLARRARARVLLSHLQPRRRGQCRHRQLCLLHARDLVGRRGSPASSSARCGITRCPRSSRGGAEHCRWLDRRT